MHNLEDVIEKYRHELMEFSKQNSAHNSTNTNYEELYRNSVQTVSPMDNVMPQTTEERPLSANRPYLNYEDFMRRNPSTGFLKVQVYAANAAYPIINALVRVSVSLAENDRELFSGYTDVDGIVDNISLPAPNESYSLDENSTLEPYAVYDITVTHPEFANGEYNNIPIFDSIKSIQPVELVPLSQGVNDPGATVINNPPMSLFGGEK